MNNHSVSYLKKKTEDHQVTYAANVKLVANAIVDSNTILETVIDTTLETSEEASIKAVRQENVFLKVMEDDLFNKGDDDIYKEVQ